MDQTALSVLLAARKLLALQVGHPLIEREGIQYLRIARGNRIQHRFVAKRSQGFSRFEP